MLLSVPVRHRENYQETEVICKGLNSFKCKTNMYTHSFQVEGITVINKSLSTDSFNIYLTCSAYALVNRTLNTLDFV